MSERKIIGLVGAIASGKGTAASYLHEQYRAEVVTFSAALKDCLTRLGLEVNRDNLIKLSEQLRAGFGEDILARVVGYAVTQSTADMVVVDGIRRLADISELQNMPGFVLVEIAADPKTRYERLIARSEKVDDQTKTYEEFLADEERSTEISIREVASKASMTVDNNGDLPHLYEGLSKIAG